MKKTLYTLGITMLIAGGMTACDTAVEKQEKAQEEVQDAKDDLQEANAEATMVATDEEWTAFKSVSESRIADNEKLIAALKVKLAKPGKALDPIYAKRIETLEQQNQEMRTRLGNYEMNKSDWDQFVNEFNEDMDNLGKSLKDFGKDEVK